MLHAKYWKAAFTFLIAFLIVAAAAQVSQAQDWPQWRGPGRDGSAAQFASPKAWPESLKLKWKVAVGEGHSSPVVAAGRVYLLTRQNDRETVSCLDLNTGKLAWQDSYATPYTMNPAAASHGKGPKSTPVVANGKLYTLGITGILSCYDAAAGRLKWRKEFSDQFKTTSPLYGTAMSPVVDRGLLIAHVGGHDSGALLGLDAETGQARWSWKGDGPGYASPIVVDLAGARQVVTQTQENIVGVSTASGELLWKIPYTTEYVQNIVTPVVYRDTIIVSGVEKGVAAIKVIKRGDQWAAEQVWHNPQVSMYMNSPVVAGDYLYGMSHRRKGQFFCLDARTGQTLWTTNGREGDNAAMLAGADALVMLTSDAELIFAAKSNREYRLLKRYTVAESPTWAHPAVAGNRILIKDATTVAMWSIE